MKLRGRNVFEVSRTLIVQSCFDSLLIKSCIVGHSSHVQNLGSQIPIGILFPMIKHSQREILIYRKLVAGHVRHQRQHVSFGIIGAKKQAQKLIVKLWILKFVRLSKHSFVAISGSFEQLRTYLRSFVVARNG